MAGLTLQQLQQMGAQPVQNTQPTQKSGGLTLQQLQQMGGKPATETRKSRMEQGLPVSSEARFARTGKAEPSDGGNLARSILNPVARVASTFNAIGQGVQELKSSQPNIANIGQPMKSQYFGSVDPLGYRKGKQLSPGQDLKDTLAVGLEAASFIPVGTGAKLAGQVIKQPFKQAIKTTAKAFGREGAIQGGLGSAGRSMQEGDTFGQTLGKTALGGAIGGVAGVGLGVGGQALTRAFTKLPQEQIKQKAIEATSKALGISGKRPVKQAMAQPEQYTKGLATVRKYADNFDPKNSDSVFDDTVKGLVTAKDKVFQTYNDIAQQAGDAGVFVDTNPLQDSLTKYVSGITTAPKKQRAIRLLRELQDNFPNGKASPLEMQQYIKLLNEELGGVAGGAERGAVGVVSDFTRQARESLDTAVGRLGKEYQSFKDEYASLKAIEDSLVRQYQKVMRKKGSGLGEYADMISSAEVLNGIISGNPALIAKGGVMRFLSSKIKSLNDPETWLKRAFDEIDKAGDVFTPQARNRASQLQSPPRSSELNIQKTGASTKPIVIPKKLQSVADASSKNIRREGGQEAFGAIAGIERDEEGNIKFNPEKAALGLGVMGSIKSKAGQSLLKKVGNKMKGVSDDLIQEAKKYKSAEEFVKAQLDKNSFVTKKPIKVYRGEGSGIGNSTLVDGQYFADSKKFAEQFGSVTESEIPSGVKVFDLDKIKSGDNIIPQEMLVDTRSLTRYLIDNGFEYTKNTNTRGVEYVKLNKLRNEMDILASKSKSPSDFKAKIMKDYDKYRPEIKRISDKYTNADWSRMRDPLDDIYRNIEDKGLPKTKSQLEEIWKKANQTSKVKIEGIKPEDIISVRKFGSSIEGKKKPNDIDHFVIVKDGSMKFSKRGGITNPIIKTVGKNQYFIMPESDGEDLLQAMLYTGRKDQDRGYSGKTIDVTKEFKNNQAGFITPKTAIAGTGITGAGAVGARGLLKRLKQKKEDKKEVSLPSKSVDTTQQFNRDDFAQRIVGVENEGELARGENVYKTVGVTGDLGKYQANPITLSEWSDPWLNKQYSKEEFLNSPEAQEKFFQNFLAVVERLKLTPEQAAVAWHTGWGMLGDKKFLPEDQKKAVDEKFIADLDRRIREDQKAKDYLIKFNR